MMEIEHRAKLIKKIMAVLAEDLDDEPVWSQVVIAKHILDALDLHRKTRPPQFYKDSTSYRFVTNWESDDE